MERVDGIMERLGFKKEASEGTKAAFIKNLIKQAYGVDVPLPNQYETQLQPQTLEEFSRDTIEGKPLPASPRRAAPTTSAQQLSFNLDDATKVG